MSDPSSCRYKYASVLGSTMAYLETGAGDPIVLLHGNPTSSFLWRNVIPHLEGLGRVIAPDLIGMGRSDKLPSADDEPYRFVQHRRYLDALLAALDVTTSVTIVGHDWGSALGFDWAFRHQPAMKAIVYMEAIVRPLDWSEWPAGSGRGEFLRRLRTPEGEKMMLDQNAFVERMITSNIRDLSHEEAEAYRAPFARTGEERRPTLTWPREFPIGGEPSDVVGITDRYAQWLAQSALPKLFINAEPGAILVGAQRQFARSWPNQTETTVRGNHYIQEDSPDQIGSAIADWYAQLAS